MTVSHPATLPQAQPFDRRRMIWRPDLAERALEGVALEGLAPARRHVDPVPARIRHACAPVRREPRPDASLDTEALFGEAVHVFEVHEGWAWVRLLGDGYVGYVPETALGPPLADPASHRVGVPRTFVYPGRSIKLPPVAALSLGSEVVVQALDGDFACIAAVDQLDRGHVWAAHLVAATDPAPEPLEPARMVDLAEGLMHVPYLWGGKTSLGLDCSGLVQVALTALGHRAPRDSDQQEAWLGTALDLSAEALDPRNLAQAGLRRGDLVFWRGHVGLMQDGSGLLHANGHHMQVRAEPLAEAAARIAATGGGPITSIRRLVAPARDD